MSEKQVADNCTANENSISLLAKLFFLDLVTFQVNGHYNNPPFQRNLYPV